MGGLVLTNENHYHSWGCMLLNEGKSMKNDACEKVVLAGSAGCRLIYCEACRVVELEIGAVSMRLNPDVLQRVANVMMKAALKLDGLVARPEPQLMTDDTVLH